MGAALVAADSVVPATSHEDAPTGQADDGVIAGLAVHESPPDPASMASSRVATDLLVAVAAKHHVVTRTTADTSRPDVPAMRPGPAVPVM